MTSTLALIGFGEAGQTFAAAAGWAAHASVFDIKVLDPARSVALLGAAVDAGVTLRDSAEKALAGQPLALSLVTADQALAAAKTAAPLLTSGTLWCDMNSVAPDTKRRAAALIDQAGGRYVDVAVMAPVNPAKLDVPLLVSGPHADAGAAALQAAGFTHVRNVGADIGRASSIKMIRSIMVKGLEALTAECLLAAHRADVVDEVAGSLGADWPIKADYNLDRMLHHGLRRAAEMEEVLATLESLGVRGLLTSGTVARQRAIGCIGQGVPDGLAAKLSLIDQSGLAQS
jgi:3-hydroxyisobutyrate dehydrogenase-like beta-hydroxyacid dehydrogenase